MALLSSYGEHNKQNNELLQQTLVPLRLDVTTGNWMWCTYQLISTKRYGYVGMDLSTAQQCAADKKAQYQISAHGWDGENVTPAAYVDGAQTVARYVAGGMYDVDVAVNLEQVERFSYPSTNPPPKEYVLSHFLSVDFDEGT